MPLLRRLFARPRSAPPETPALPVRAHSERRPGPMRVAAISRILDEADIVEAFVRHTAAYADHHIFVDNGSRDGTVEILRALKAEGFDITVFQNTSVTVNEQRFNTRMYHHAVEAHEADWVLCLDADEFIDDRAVPGGLNDALRSLMVSAPDMPCIRVPLIGYLPSSEDDTQEAVVPLRLSRRGPAVPGRRAYRKVFVRGALAGVTIKNGNHQAAIDGVDLPTGAVAGLWLAHYPHRSPYQAAVKSAKGWAKVLASGPMEVRRGTSRHYRDTFALLRDRPQQHFRSHEVLQPKPDATITTDPIAYRGGPLRYTLASDEPMRAIRGMMGYLEDLATCHGLLTEEHPAVRARVEAWNGELERIL